MSTSYKLIVWVLVFLLACEKPKAQSGEKIQTFDTLVEIMKQAPELGLLSQRWQVLERVNNCDVQAPDCSYLMINGLRFSDTIPISNAELLNGLQKSLILQIINPADPTQKIEEIAQQYLKSKPTGTKRKFQVSQVEKLKYALSILVGDSLLENGNWIYRPTYRSISLSSSKLIDFHHLIDTKKFESFLRLVEKESKQILAGSSTTFLTQNFYLSRNGIVFCYELVNKSGVEIKYLTLSYQDLQPLLSQEGKILTLN